MFSPNNAAAMNSTVRTGERINVSQQFDGIAEASSYSIVPARARMGYPIVSLRLMVGSIACNPTILGVGAEPWYHARLYRPRQHACE